MDERIRELGDWRGKALSKVRGIIKEADPDIVEEWKWAKATSPGTPVWSRSGDICTGETYRNGVKLRFFKGAALDDPSGLFNSSLDVVLIREQEAFRMKCSAGRLASGGQG